MATDVKRSTRNLPATPWGLLPPRLRVLYVATARRTGAWLAEAFANDSASEVILEEARGAANGVARLRDQVFDAVLVSHEPPELDALELLDGLRAGGAEEPVVVLGEASEQELAALAYEVGADAYVCAHTATTRMLLWIVARATERRHLLREHRRLSQAEQHRLRREQREAERTLTEQRGMIRDAQAAPVQDDTDDAPRPRADCVTMIGSRAVAEQGPAIDEAIVAHYRELLRAHVIMGEGNLSAEMSTLAKLLADTGISAPQAMQLHVQVLEELVRGLGNRSARHVMTRADLLVLEVLVHLAEQYRLRSLRSESGELLPVGTQVA